MKVMHVFGTRPEAIKMAPVVEVFQKASEIENYVCLTGQHRQLLDQVIDFFGIVVDYDLDIMADAQDLANVTARILVELTDVFDEVNPDFVLVHGDTNTAMSAALAAFYRNIPVGHVEAGLRTYNLLSPWPEEANRLLVDSLAAYCYAPTLSASENLHRENKHVSKVLVTGNTVIDALFIAKSRIFSDPERIKYYDRKFEFLDKSKKLILVTGHRRESFGRGFKGICTALETLSRREDVEILYPVHLNPMVKGPVERSLLNLSNVHLVAPLDYAEFIYVMDRSFLVLTDSGGVQEEAPSLGKPVLVMRETTERPEAVEAGTVRLVGTEPETIVSEVELLLQCGAHYSHMSNAHNPYGDGKAAQRILEHVLSVRG